MDHERVAALHDGRLAGDDRDELLAAIAANDEEYELFAETAGVLRDLEAARSSSPAASTGAVTISAGPEPAVNTDADTDEDPADVIPIATRRPADEPAAETSGDVIEEAGVIPIDSRRKAPGRRWMVYGALAATLAGIGVTATLMNRSANALLDDPVRAVRMLDAGAAPGMVPGLSEALRSTKRGAGDDLTEEQRTVRVGAYLVDLELAAAAHQSDSIRTISGKVAALLDADTLSGNAAVSSIYRQVEQQAAPGRNADVRPLLEEGRESVRLLMPAEWLELGIWAEAARTAAVRRDAEFFRSSTTGRVLDRATALPNAGEPMRTAIGAVRSSLPVGGRADWPGLRDALTELLRVAGR